MMVLCVVICERLPPILAGWLRGLRLGLVSLRACPSKSKASVAAPWQMGMGRRRLHGKIAGKEPNGLAHTVSGWAIILVWPAMLQACGPPTQQIAVRDPVTKAPGGSASCAVQTGRPATLLSPLTPRALSNFPPSSDISFGMLIELFFPPAAVPPTVLESSRGQSSCALPGAFSGPLSKHFAAPQNSLSMAELPAWQFLSSGSSLFDARGCVHVVEHLFHVHNPKKNI